MQSKFSYPLKLEDISSTSKEYHLQTSPKELSYISKELKLPGVKSFEALINVKLNKAEHQVLLDGHIIAMVEHISVISLKRFNRPYKINFSLVFDTQMTYAMQRELEDFNDINAEIPEIIENGKIDLAAVAMEQLAVELDDFPRMKGEKFDFKPDFNPEDDKPESPFAILKNVISDK